MRKHMVLTVLALMCSLIIGIQLVTTQVMANSIPADVDIDPDSLLMKKDLRAVGKWITVYIKLPEEYDVHDINVSSVVLKINSEEVGVLRSDIQDDKLMVKFDRAMVTNLIWWIIGHMSPHVKHEVTLIVTGNLDNGDTFEGSDTIKVFSNQP